MQRNEIISPDRALPDTPLGLRPGSELNPVAPSDRTPPKQMHHSAESALYLTMAPNIAIGKSWRSFSPVLRIARHLNATGLA
jgi:hypothetical protein